MHKKYKIKLDYNERISWKYIRTFQVVFYLQILIELSNQLSILLFSQINNWFLPPWIRFYLVSSLKRRKFRNLILLNQIVVVWAFTLMLDTNIWILFLCFLYKLCIFFSKCQQNISYIIDFNILSLCKFIWLLEQYIYE